MNLIKKKVIEDIPKKEDIIIIDQTSNDIVKPTIIKNSKEKPIIKKIKKERIPKEKKPKPLKRKYTIFKMYGRLFYETSYIIVTNFAKEEIGTMVFTTPRQIDVEAYVNNITKKNTFTTLIDKYNEYNYFRIMGFDDSKENLIMLVTEVSDEEYMLEKENRILEHTERYNKQMKLIYDKYISKRK